MFFWSLYRPAALPPPIVFVIGLLLDLLGYLPLGTGVLTLLLVHGLARRWRRTLTQQGFVMVWLVFIGVGTGAALLIWTLTSLLSLRLMPFGPAAFQATLTAAPLPRAGHAADPRPPHHRQPGAGLMRAGAGMEGQGLRP